MIDRSAILEQIPALYVQKIIEGFLTLAKMIATVPNIFLIAVIVFLVLLGRRRRK